MRSDVLETVSAGLAGDVAGTFNHPRDDRSPVVQAILAGGVGGQLGVTAPDGLPGSKGEKHPAYNTERDAEYVDLTTRKAWTVADVRRLLPDVACIFNGRAIMGRIVGRKCDYATVIPNNGMDAGADFAWASIAASLNNNRALRF